MPTTTDPRFMDAPRWAAQTSFLLSRFGVIPTLTDARDWRGWAAYVISLPAIAALDPPLPQGFATWEAWAHRFNTVLRLIAI